MLWVWVASAIGWAIGLGLRTLGLGLLVSWVLVFFTLGWVFKLVRKVLCMPFKLLAWALGALFVLMLIAGMLFLLWLGLGRLSVCIF
ncbi:MAG: hypothetical protein NZ742_11385 [Acidobacteria bacterium]|nr:hypothetical protein [Acidobacteriota bacterium]MDW7985286.1 hypothetical protein [Acidobacteriota bacterium]